MWATEAMSESNMNFVKVIFLGLEPISREIDNVVLDDAFFL